MFALDHFVAFGIADTTRLEQDRAKWYLELLQAEVVYPWKLRAYAAKRLASVDKQEVDALRLERLPPVAVCKEAVHNVYCDLAIIAERAQVTGSLSRKERHVANAAIAAAIVLGTFAGRAGEWHGMDKEKVVGRLEAGARMLVCGRHKTAKYYGSIAKWIPAGLAKALLTYAKLPGTTTTKLLEFHLAPALKAFGLTYVPDHEYPRSNLVRKMFHTVLLRCSREGEAMRLIGEADGHSPSMALHTYALSGPNEDCSVGELVYRKVMGDPVPWPNRAAINRRKGMHEQLLDSVAAACEEQLAIADWSDDEAMDVVETMLRGDGDEEKLALEDQAAAAAAGRPAKRAKRGEAAATAAPAAMPAAAAAADADADAPPPAPKKGRKSPFTAAEKHWIAAQCSKFYSGVVCMSAPTLSFVQDEIALLGLAEQRFQQRVDPNDKEAFNKFVAAVRHVCRTWPVHMALSGNDSAQ